MNSSACVLSWTTFNLPWDLKNVCLYVRSCKTLTIISIIYLLYLFYPACFFYESITLSCTQFENSYSKAYWMPNKDNINLLIIITKEKSILKQFCILQGQYTPELGRPSVSRMIMDISGKESLFSEVSMSTAYKRPLFISVTNGKIWENV